MNNLLGKYKSIEDLKKMSFEELEVFSEEIRQFLIDKVSKTGGHLASNLGVVELTLSLFKVFDFNSDKLVWDVGHQAYVHKILTGRKDRFDTLRTYGGISGFPKSEESKYDMFNTGHSSTSISAALGMARARDLQGKDYDVVAVIGDGALTGGMALEALNDVGYRKTKLIILLNDNQMSICQNVGGLSSYLSKIRIDPKYNDTKKAVIAALNKSDIGKSIAKSLRKIKGSIKQFIVPGMFFEDMGIKYLGPIDGHDMRKLNSVLNAARALHEPVLIHCITTKGKGYNHAEVNPNKFHGVGPFDCDSGEVCATSSSTYSKAFGEELVKLAAKDDKIVAITAAMRDGTGLSEFSKKYKDRFFDVGIAEQHAVTLAAGMAKSGLKPVFAVYSTFLQRAYDQILHDVCIQNLPVVFAIDRAGIVGEDGETHQGVFDLSFLSHIPNITIMSPKCVNELKVMLKWAVEQSGPVAVRYPRGGDKNNLNLKALSSITMGKWEIINDEGKIAVIACGKMVQTAMEAKEKLGKLGIKITLINACFVKPVDTELLDRLIDEKYKLVTIEDNILSGGFGSQVVEYVNFKQYEGNVTCLGFKDEFITHGSTEILYRLHGLDADGVAEKIASIQ